MPTIPLSVTTNAGGEIRLRDTFDPPGPFGATVTARVRLVEPPGARVEAVLDLEAANGSTSNAPRPFAVDSGGAAADLGSWELWGGENRVRLDGRTVPPLANTRLDFELDVSL